VNRLRERVERVLGACWWRAQPGLLAHALRPLAWLYRALALAQRAASRPQAVGVPVLVVGNLVVGGAGKTPTVIALVRLLRALGFTPGVVSRGHGRRESAVLEVREDSDAGDCGDEPLLIRLRTGVPMTVGRDRVAAARALLAAHPDVDLIVSDDGLQHRRLARKIEVIVFDERGAGNGLLLPAGPLREPLPRHLPGHCLVLYNAPHPTTPLPGWLATRALCGVVPLRDWWHGRVAERDSWRALAGRPLLALAGIAAPQRFFDMLRGVGAVVQPHALPDHHDYAQLPWPQGTPDVVLTEKDAVKLRPERDLGATRVWVAPLDFEPELAFVAALRRCLPQPPSPATRP
jgi:tetraacyldisaccharide 4'-kinase